MWSQHISFWMICGYLFFEFVRPQALFPALKIIPWAQLFILGSIIGAVIDTSVKYVSDSANKLMYTFLLLILISIYFANFRDISKERFMDFFGWFVIYFCIINIVNTGKRFYVFLLIYLFAAAKIALGTTRLWAERKFSFRTWGLMGPEGFFENSGELAILMLMLFPLAFYIYRAKYESLKNWEKIILIAAWVCAVLTVLGSSSRGAQVALVIQVAIMFRSKIFKIKVLLMIVIASASLFLLLPPEQKERFTKAGKDESSMQRELYWKNGLKMINDYPLTGVGFFNFSPEYEKHYSADMIYARVELPHNIFIQVGTDAGVPALLIFMLIILYCFKTTYGIAKKEGMQNSELAIAKGLGIGVLGFVLAGQFVTVAYYPFLWIHLALICAFKNVLQKEGKV